MTPERPDHDPETPVLRAYRAGVIHERAGAVGHGMVDWMRPARPRDAGRAHVTGLGFIVGAVALALVVAVMGVL